jgi:two-component system chemotaxis sensor kinase CheA
MSGEDPVAAFRIEAGELLEQIEADLLDLGADLANAALVDAVFRGLHTLKGSGAMFGFDALAAFTHHCETAFDRVRKGAAEATAPLVGVILAARDHMRALLEDGENPALAEQGAAIIASLAAATEGASMTCATAAAPVAPPSHCPTPAAGAGAAGHGWRVRFALPPGALANGTNPLALLDELRALGARAIRAHRDAIPPLDALDPGDCHIRWELELPAGVTRADFDDVFIFVMDDMELAVEPLALAPAAAADPAPADAAERRSGDDRRSGEERRQGWDERRTGDRRAGGGDTVRVPAERLDELMNRVGELVITQSRLAQLAGQRGGVSEIALRAVAEDIERLSNELRDTTMALRMMPVGALFGRFRRLVHDLAQETGKAIAYATEGEATEVDKTVIERIADPLVHLIRNACDHGIEPPEARAASGKLGGGRITLSAEQVGGEVVIRVADDGRGINRAAVRAKAEAQGLIAPDTVLADRELLQLIFQPGFSTAAAVTNLSGRGVGMDVVKKTIEGLRGSIEITSEEGRGAEVRLHLPLTLAIVECMFVRIGAARYALPLSAVEECLELPAQEATASAAGSGRSFVNLRGELVPYLRMRDLFPTDHPTELYPKIVVVSAAGTRVGLMVDQIIGNAQTVIKPLSRFHVRANVFAGATIVGDGGVALIVDVANLLAASRRQVPCAGRIGEAA